MNIQNFSNIVLFDERGYEIELQRLFNFEFRLSFAQHIPFYVIRQPNLCIVGNSDKNNPVFEVVVNEPGIFRAKEGKWNSETFINGNSRFYDVEIIYHAKNGKAFSFNYARGLKKEYLEFTFEKVDLYSENSGKPIAQEYKIQSVKIDEELNKLLAEFLYGAQDTTNARKIIKSKSVAEIVGADNLYPFYNFVATYKQEPVSTELVSATTFFILEEKKDDEGNVYYDTPVSDEYDLFFSFQNSSEVRFINNNKEIDEITWTNHKSIVLNAESEEHDNPKPLAFSIGFSSNEEGCFENSLLVYARKKKEVSEQREIFYLGSIVIKSESIGEDERYRTLFTNFGIPDPITYPNLFKEQDPDEQGVDFELINRKSKELFLTYDKIFPYVGTYKALINAVHFLGYDDIYFKEWYKIIDKDRESTNALFTSVDFANGEILSSSLAKYGISPEDFFNYKKLNKLSLIYMLNLEKADYDLQTVYDTSTGEKAVKYFDVPTVIRNFDYSNDAILAKLYSLKAWLEKYIIGINARIVDVTGEGIYFYRFETTAYSTGNVLIDYYNESHLTPYQVKVSTDDGKMKDSSANVKCSVYEFDNMKFSDFINIPIRDFIYELGIIGVNQETGKIDASFTNDREMIETYHPSTNHVINSVIPISHTLECPLLFNELSYNLETESSCGTLVEYADEAYVNNPILIRDNKIEFYNQANIESWIANGYLPTIVLKKANLRKVYGDWSNNIVFTIKPVFDTSTRETVYQMALSSYPSNSSVFYGVVPKIYSGNDIVLRPNLIDLENEDGTVNKIIDPSARFGYTEKTKYNVPLFIISKYNIDLDSNAKKYFNIKDGTYVLEILDGELRFDTKSVTNKEGDVSVAMTAEVTFQMEDWNTFGENTRDEQVITPVYNFQTAKFNVMEYTLEDSSVLEEVLDSITNNEKADYYRNIDAIKENKRKDFIRKAITQYKLPYIDSSNRDIFKDSSITYEEILQDISAGIQEQATKTILDDTYEHLFIDASCLVEEYVVSSIMLDLSRIDERLYDNFQRAIKDPSVYKVNDEINVNVSRLGDYKLSVLGYDKYNNIFINDSNVPAKVFGVRPAIDLYTNTSYSNNSSNFFKDNKFGDLLYHDEDGEPILSSSDFIMTFEESPRFPKSYRIYDISVNDEDISYPSISYAIDSPKSNDFLHFNNFTEIGTRIEKDEETSYIKVSMLDENEDCAELYYYNCAVMVYVFDNLHFNLVNSFGPFNVKNFRKQETLTDTNYYDDSYIMLECPKDSSLQNQEFLDTLNAHLNDIGDWDLFLAPVTEFFVDNNLIKIYNENGEGKISIVRPKNNSIEDVKIDYDTMLTPPFRTGDVIKLTYQVFNQNFYAYDFFDYKGETAYRIKDSKVEKTYYNGNQDTYTNTFVVTHTYTLDGSLNTSLLDGIYNNYAQNKESKTYCKFSYPSFDFVDFIVDAKSMGDEEVYVKKIENNLNETLETRMTVGYDSSKWFANNYLDNTYSMYDIDFDHNKLKQDWYNASTLFDSSTEIYKYSDFPITLDKERVLVVSSSDTEETFDGYNSRWKWMIRYANENDYYPNDTYYIGENPNAPIQKTESILYRSVNDVMTILTNYAGNNDIELEAIDRFGNRLFNEGSGILFVNNAKQAEKISLIN